MAAQREEEDGCTEGGIGRGWLHRGRDGVRMAAQREEWGEDGCTEGGIGRGWLNRGRDRVRMAAQREGWAGMTEQRAGLATQFKRRNGYWCRKVLAQLPWRCPYFRERCLLRKVSLYNVYTSHKMDNC